VQRFCHARAWPRDSPADKDKDRTAAREKLADVLRQAGDQEQGKWREQAEFIKSLLDKPGKALPEGKIPPPKTPVAPLVGGAGPVEKKDDPAAKKDEPAKKPDEPKKED